MNRLDLTNAVHSKLSGIAHRRVYQAIGIIIDQIVADLVSDQVVTVRRFGTLSPHVRQSHLAHNVSTGAIRKLESRRSVKFHPHEAFKKLIRERQERFRHTLDLKA